MRLPLTLVVLALAAAPAFARDPDARAERERPARESQSAGCEREYRECVEKVAKECRELPERATGAACRPMKEHGCELDRVGCHTRDK